MTIRAEGIVAVPRPLVTNRRRLRELLGLEAEHLEQLGERAATRQLPLQPLDRQRLLKNPRIGAVEEIVGELEEQLAKLVVPGLEDVEEVAEIVADDGPVVVELGLVQPSCGKEAADVVDGADAIAQRLDPGPPLGSRQVTPLPTPPQIHRLVQDVDGARQVVGGKHDPDVLVPHPLGKAKTMPLPKGPAEELVASEPVDDERWEIPDVRSETLSLERLPEHLGARRPERREPADTSAGEVGARPLERCEQRLVRPPRHRIVAVDERDELSFHLVEACVARRALTSVLLAQEPETAVTGGEASGDLRAFVRRAVVDHDDFEAGNRLLHE